MSNISLSNERIIYIHFLDLYHYRRAHLKNLVSHKNIEKEARRALRICLLLSERIFIPASSFFEGPLCAKLVSEVEEFVHAGNIVITASEESLGDHIEYKRDMYSKSGSDLINAYKERKISLPYINKTGSSTKLIQRAWLEQLNGNLFNFLDPACERDLPRNLEYVWESIPDLLGEEAFIVEHADRIATDWFNTTIPIERLEYVIEGEYNFSYAGALKADLMGDMLYFHCAYDTAFQGKILSYRRIYNVLVNYKVQSLLDGDADGVLYLTSKHPKFLSIRDSIVNGIWNEHTAKVIDAVIQDSIKTKKLILPIGIHMKQEEKYVNNVKMGVICALPEELFAVERSFDELFEDNYTHNGDPIAYSVGSIINEHDNASDTTIAAACLTRMGNSSASFAGAHMLRTFPNIKLILLVGISAGVPNTENPRKHVRLGDVLVSDRKGIVAYSDVVKSQEGEESRALAPPPSAIATRTINYIEKQKLAGKDFLIDSLLFVLEKSEPILNKPDVSTDIILDSNGDRIEHPFQDDRVENWPLIHRCNIGSADILLKDAVFRDTVAKKYNLMGFEMEGKGVAEAVWQVEKSYIVIKGVCDYGDRTKTDEWHMYAACSAAAFFRVVAKYINFGDNN